MKLFYTQHRFTNFMLFALLAMAINLAAAYKAGYATVFSTIIYIAGSLLLIIFIVLHKLRYDVAAKILSALFFNTFFFIFTYYYGLRSLVFIYYFPFLVSYIYLYKDNATGKEAKVFTYSSFAFIIAIFFVCTMNGQDVLTKEQEVLMYKKNFLVAFALSAYYFNAIFSYLMIQMKLAEEASASKARFLSIMSHELRTPLNGIISAINLIDATKDEKEKQKFGTVLKTSSEHLLNLVNNVLDYSKASSGKMQLNPVNASVNKLITNLQAVFDPRFEEAGLEFKIHLDDEVCKPVMFDDIRLAQVLSNLLSNALKFTEKGKVVLAARCLNANSSSLEVEFSVTDTGKGLTDEHQNKIFDSFNTVNNKSRKLESSGLGLSISKMIVEMMGGSLLLNSKIDKGSRFYFNVHMPLANTVAKTETITKHDFLSLEGKNILIAEDNLINMMVAREFLKKWNVNLLEAPNGLVAQQLLIKNADIDLLLLDLQMPEMDGYELMEWIRENKLQLPVIAFTAQIMAHEDKNDLIQLGFTDMIPKPFAPQELHKKISHALIKNKTPIAVL